jgi:hypothetical protein
MSEALCSFCDIVLMIFRVLSGRASQTFSASIKASRNPLEGREVMYS